jgi:hypothetical protein
MYIFDEYFFGQLKSELIHRYNIQEELASEMASDLLEVLVATDSNVEIFQKYFLVS